MRTYAITLYRPTYLLSYLGHSPRMLWKMIAGTYQVGRQYLAKLKEAERG
jgi:hypothetical protein